MQTKIVLYRFCFVTETLCFPNIAFPGQYVKEVSNVIICKHTLLRNIYIYMCVFVLEKDVIFHVLTDSREIKN